MLDRYDIRNDDDLRDAESNRSLPFEIRAQKPELRGQKDRNLSCKDVSNRVPRRDHLEKQDLR